MALKIILSVTDGNESSEVRDLLCNRYGFSFTALLQLALRHWDSMKFTDPEILRAAVEGAAHQQVAQQITTYAEMAEVVDAVCRALYQIHDIIDGALGPVLELAPNNGDLSIRFVRWLASSVVVEIDPRLT